MHTINPVSHNRLWTELEEGERHDFACAIKTVISSYPSPLIMVKILTGKLQFAISFL